MIELNSFGRQWEDTRWDAMAAFAKVGESGWYVLGREVEEFEKALAARWQMRHAVGVASGLDAIEISLRALGCKAGDLVLTTPLSAFATTLAILKVGAVLVFADVDSYGLIDLEAAREALRGNPGIRFFVPVHLFGHALDSAKLAALRDEFGVKMVEDCAQSIGASFAGKPTGSVGQMAATSFYPTKNLGAFGDGGAILTNNDDLARTARTLRDYGQTAKYQHTLIGYNSRLDELQAALLQYAALPRLDGWIAARRRVAGAYLDGITNGAVYLPGAPRGCESSWHLFPVLVRQGSKPALMRHMKELGVQTGEHYPTAIPDQQALSGMETAEGQNVTHARKFCKSEVSLPIHPYLTAEEVSTVIAAVNAWKP